MRGYEVEEIRDKMLSIMEERSWRRDRFILFKYMRILYILRVVWGNESCGLFYNDLTRKTEVILSLDILLKFYLFFVFEYTLVFFFSLKQIHFRYYCVTLSGPPNF